MPNNSVTPSIGCWCLIRTQKTSVNPVCGLETSNQRSLTFRQGRIVVVASDVGLVGRAATIGAREESEACASAGTWRGKLRKYWHPREGAVLAYIGSPAAGTVNLACGTRAITARHLPVCHVQVEAAVEIEEVVHVTGGAQGGRVGHALAPMRQPACTPEEGGSTKV